MVPSVQTAPCGGLLVGHYMIIILLLYENMILVCVYVYMLCMYALCMNDLHAGVGVCMCI